MKAGRVLQGRLASYAAVSLLGILLSLSLSMPEAKAGNVAAATILQSDPLTEPKTKEELQADTTDLWRFGGSADVQGAPSDFFQDAEGLHIGVGAQSEGTYAGYYAVTNSEAFLFHAIIMTPFRTTTGGVFQNGAYVQTDNGLVNYVTCVAITDTLGTSWNVVHALGNYERALTAETLWSDASLNQPLTRDCIIITNGTNYLKVLLDNVPVYENSSLDLRMPPPFLYFLEPQNSHAEMLYGIYRDFYATTYAFNSQLTVGGEIVAIDMPSVLFIAGASNVSWALPTLLGSIGALVGTLAVRKRWSEKN